MTAFHFGLQYFCECTLDVRIMFSSGLEAVLFDHFFVPLQITEIPNLTSGCTEFVESAQQILEERKINQTLLANHSTLLDLLEIPQLMDTYVLIEH